MSGRIRIAIIGLGQIARLQHVPAVQNSDDFELVCTVDPNAAPIPGIPLFRSIAEAVASGIHFNAASVTTPPLVRPEICERLIDAGSALLLEKPPASTLEAAARIKHQAAARGVTVFAAWHSRYAPQVKRAEEWARSNPEVQISINWRENPAKWHPGQAWLFQEGGFGVFDPGINALSILTLLYPFQWLVVRSCIHVREGAGAPDSAAFELRLGQSQVQAHLEFHDRQDEIWDIEFKSATGARMLLSEGAAAIQFNGAQREHKLASEYTEVYRRFADLIRCNASECDLIPLELAHQVLTNADRSPEPAVRF